MNNPVMFMKNSQGTGLYNSLPIISMPEVVWKVKTDGQVISSPVVSNEIVYVGSNDKKLYAIDAIEGSIKWVFKTEGEISSTPAVSNGKVFFLSYDGNFYCLNQNDGSLIWKFRTGGESKHYVKDYYNGEFKSDFWDFYLSSPVVKDNVVYFGSSDYHVYALAENSGKIIWQFKTNGKIHSSPAIFENSLVIGSWDSDIYCLDTKSGAEKWIFETGKDTAQYIWLGIQGSPSIDNEIAYIGSRDAKFYALNIISGDTLWSKNDFDMSWMPSSAAIGKENIYTGSSDSFSFFSINKNSGEINYKTKTNSYTFSSPAIDEKMAYIGSANGRLFGIDLKSGDVKWEFKTIGNALDTIKMFDDNGLMDVNRMRELTKNIKDMPSLSTLFDKAFIGSGAILSTPTISNDILYFGSSDGYIYALKNIP